jgi:nicotinamidase-related amidase
MKSGLIIVDIQNDYFPGGKMELTGSIEASLKANTILNYFRNNGLPVFHIQHTNIRKGATFFLPDTEGLKIHENVEPIENEIVIHKYFPNSFRNTNLLENLNKSGVTDLVVCGMMTHMCIDATVRAAFDNKYNCVVLNDACATKDLTFNNKIIPSEFVHCSFLAALNGVYAKVLNTEDLLNSLK